jgi:general secretion pathway protein F
MPAYRYEAATAAGRIETGNIDADSPKIARSMLRERGLTPVSIEIVQESDQRSAIGGKLRQSDLMLATRQMASLLSAKLPLEQALSAIVEQADKGLLRDRFSAVRSDVVAGQSFAEALSRYPRDFPDIYRALVAAGEQSGDLGVVMERLADYTESRSALSQKLITAFIYPVIVTLVALGVIVLLLTYVVPQVVGVFAQSKQKLPWLTEVLIAMSAFARSWGVWIALALVLAFVGFRMALRNEATRLAWHALLMRVPIFGRLIRGFNSARFAGTLAILTSAGVPLLRALDAGAQTLNNLALKDAVMQAIGRVREGVPLGKALKATKVFPPMLIHLISSGEETGELPQMLERGAKTMSGDVERRALQLTSILEPMLILGMGVIVLLIVIAVMLPIIEINQMVR